MGTFATVVVCTAAGYASSYTRYFGANPYNITLNANETYTAVVTGGNCSFKISGDQATVNNSYVDTFNVTGLGQFNLEPFGCNLTTIQACQTGYFQVTDAPYQFITQEYENFLPGISSQLQNLQYEQNFTYVVLPPVPSQPPMFFFDSYTSATTVTAFASSYSSQYGSNLIGCVLSAGAGGSNYAGTNLPSQLTSGNAGLPSTASAQYGVSQGQALTFLLGNLNLKSSTLYDFVFACYNGNGMSPATQYFQVPTAASSLPSTPGNAAIASHTAGWAAALLSIAVAGFLTL